MTVPHIPFFHRFEEPSLAVVPRSKEANRWGKVSTDNLAQTFAHIVQEIIARAGLKPEDEVARGCFLRELSRAVAALDGMVGRDMESWKRLARKSVQWPILATLNPRIAESQRQRLRSLELGREAFLSMKLDSRTSTDDAATRYAISILLTLNDNRDSWAELLDPKAPQWAKRASELPPFNKGTWRQWWLPGKEAFSEAIAHPEEIKELEKLAHAKKTPSAKRALIIERIARAVRSLAPA